MPFIVTRQSIQEIAQILLAGALVFALLWWLARRRGRGSDRQLRSAVGLGVVTALLFGISFAPFVPNIPTPPVPFTARFQSNPVPDTQEHIDAGRRLFQENCAICHGPQALGNGPAAFTLNPRPFNLQVHVPLHPTGEVFYWISNGVSGTGMPAWKDKLTEEQRWEIIRFVDALAAKRTEQ